MIKYPFLTLLLLLTTGTSQSFAFTTDQPLAEPNLDLRSQQSILSVELVESERAFSLDKTVNGDYFLRQTFQHEDRLIKIAGREASRIDRIFSKHFLSCQFEIPAIEGECKVTLRLKLRSDTQEICLKDEQKTQKINSFIDAELRPRFLKN